jgi:methionine-rich copper-binding protein CopC
MPATPTAVRTTRRVAVVLVALAALAIAGGGPARAADTPPPLVHHVLPENDAVLAAAPDHFEIMFDVDLVPGQVDVGLAPGATGRLVTLPGPPVLDGPLLVQPLPSLPAGRYTVGIRVRGAGGQLARGTFGFAVDPAAPAPAASTGSSGSSRSSVMPRWLVPVVGAALLVPAAGLALRRTRRRPPCPRG